MITDGFERNSPVIIAPGAFREKGEPLSDTAIATFSSELYEEALRRYPSETVGELRAANHCKPVHLLELHGRKVVFYLSEIASALASTDIIEVNWLTDARRFIVFGSCGSLMPQITTGRYIVPTAAYRDEGISYHYAEPSDYIAVKNAAWMAEFFDKASLPYVQGRVWTTDAFYRETRKKVEDRKAEGCIAVEMELAGMQAVCDYHGWELYDFLAAGDTVDQPEYTPAGLSAANHSTDKLDIAVMIAQALTQQG